MLRRGSKLELVLQPTQIELDEVHAWLTKEHADTGESFIFNWTVIEKCFARSSFACLKLRNETVAFLIWSASDRVAEVTVMAVRPDLRGQGIGAHFIELLFPILHSQLGVLVLKLECMPTSSEPFWRSHQFLDFPPNYYPAKDSGIHLFRSLIEPPILAAARNASARLELWHKQPHEVKTSEPADEVIDLPLDGVGRFAQTAAIPANTEWKARLTYPGLPTQEGKVKYLFARSCLESGFIVGIPILSQEASQGNV